MGHLFSTIPHVKSECNNKSTCCIREEISISYVVCHRCKGSGRLVLAPEEKKEIPHIDG